MGNDEVMGDAGMDDPLWDGEGSVRLKVDVAGEEGGGVVVDGGLVRPPKGALNEDDDDGLDRVDLRLRFAAAADASRSVWIELGCESGGAETESEHTFEACPTSVLMGSSLLRSESRPGVRPSSPSTLDAHDPLEGPSWIRMREDRDPEAIRPEG